ncbi:HAD family hydrolase [Ktedonosporobacter rubrisoli]|uniref:HAD family hydrolase n=1 Tax=Ktedonosporobacter rubrisoli TaxID=2509675 RepID=A0A4P6K4L3_KTERU|nr:HAD family hydrolase [Ktedonosporobacter rubrisoli]QBD83179.1 HAD family hydrolase [Ktedonosporobacter rubrisoli]
MTSLQAVVFDLGGTLVDWPDWDSDAGRRWGLSYDYLVACYPERSWPSQADYVQAMREAEKYHWQQVEAQQTSSTPAALLTAGFRRLDLSVSAEELLDALDGYARAVDGWAIVFPDAVSTLQQIRQRDLRIGLLSNTWWAAEWHNADLVVHGLAPLLDEIVYTSDLPHSKPHPSVFLEVTARLQVEPSRCVMVGDRMFDDIGGALGVGMRAVWRETKYPWPRPEQIVPSAKISALAELLPLLDGWL